MKIWIKLFVCILFVFSFSFHANAASRFKDVQLYETYINYLTDNNIIRGYPDGSFKPEYPVSRLQVIQMVINAKQIPLTKIVDPHLEDVKPDSYGYNYMAKAIELGLINKHGNKFEPYIPITRGEVAYVLAHSYTLTGTTQIKFKDVSDSYFAANSIYMLAENNITRGYPDGTFKPNETLQRQHFSVFLAKTLNEDFRTDDTNAPLTPKGIVQKVDDRVVMISDNNVQGSGVFVGQGLLITNAHVVKDMDLSQAKVKLNNGKFISVIGLVAYDENKDLALLKTENTNISPVKIGDPAILSKGDDIYAIGSPEGLQNTISTGIVSGFRNMNGVQMIQITSPINHGSSGGGLFDNQGDLVGITSSGISTNLYFAISIDEANSWANFYEMAYKDIPIIKVQPSFPFKINNVELGMTKDQVLQAATGTIVGGTSEVYLAFNDSLNGFITHVVYEFPNNTLEKVGIIIPYLDTISLSDASLLFDEMTNYLMGQYGSPQYVDDNIYDDLSERTHWEKNGYEMNLLVYLDDNANISAGILIDRQ